jgi:hypothetical protein
MFVAVAHTAVSTVFFGEVYSQLIQSGLFNSVTSEKSGLTVWFFLLGFILFVFAMLCAVIEKNYQLQIAKSIGIALLILIVLGVALMPVSGFWLMLPAVFAILIKKTNTV